MKLKFIPILILSIILALTASSCSPAQVTATLSTNDVTEQTPTDFPPTATSTTTPTSTPKPTETPDPLAGAPDKKATGKDANGNWFYTKTTEKGTTLTCTYDSDRKTYFTPIFSGPMLDWAQEINDTGMKEPDLWQLDMYVDSANIDQIPMMSHNANMNPMHTIDFNALLNSLVLEGLINKGVINSPADFNFTKLNAKKFYFDFINANGPQRLGLWPGVSIKVHVRSDYDALKADMAINGFSETQKSKLYGPENSYMIKIWTDDKNNEYVDIAPSLPVSQWTEDMLYEMGFIGLEAVEYPDLTHPESGSITNKIIKNREKFPYFTFSQP